MAKILTLCHASLPKPAGSLFSPKYQLWNFAAHKAALLPREGNLSDGQLASQCCWPCQGRHKQEPRVQFQQTRLRLGLLCKPGSCTERRKIDRVLPGPHIHSKQVNSLEQPWEAENYKHDHGKVIILLLMLKAFSAVWWRCTSGLRVAQSYLHPYPHAAYTRYQWPDREYT